MKRATNSSRVRGADNSISFVALSMRQGEYGTRAY